MNDYLRFAQLWTGRWFDEAHLDDETAQQWHTELCGVHKGNWIRLVSAGWLGKEYENLDRVSEAVEWFGSQASGLFFCCPRARNSTTLGVQWWLASEQDEFLVNLMAYPLRQKMVLTPEHFSAHVTMLTQWRKIYRGF